MHIGKKIKTLMESSDSYSPVGFALALGKKNKQTYYDMVKRSDIHTKDLKKIAAYFKVPVTDFFDQEQLGRENRYLEDRVAELEKRVDQLETRFS